MEYKMFSALTCVFTACVAGIYAQNLTTSMPNVTIAPTNGTNFTTVMTTATASTTTIKTTVDKCWGKSVWRSELVDIRCTTPACATTAFRKYSEYLTCNEKKKSWNEIAENAFDFAESVASTFTSTSPSSIHGNGSLSFITDHFLVEVGFLNRQRSDLRLLSTVPVYTANPASSYTGMKDTVTFAVLTLNPGVTSYYILLYKDLIATTTLLKFKSEMPEIVTKLEDLGKYKQPKTRSGKWVLNSQVVRIGFTPSPAAITEPITVTFFHKVLIKRLNHDCISFSGDIDNARAIWSTKGCHRISSTRFKTVCVFTNPGVYAVISQIEEVSVSSKGFSRTFLTIIATAISIFIILGLLCSILYPIVKGYFHLLRVRINVFHDMACLMVYFLFIIGVGVSENAKNADSVASCIHFFQTAVISWLFVEGVHNYHLLNPVYDPEVTSPTFFYNTIGWGIPAALSGACAGYAYQLESAEFSWMKVSGSGMIYFIVGPLASFIAVLVTYGLIFYELRSWIGSKRDYEYRKCIEYYKRSSIILLVAFLTWYTGIMARNDTNTLFYSYLFLAFYGSQGASMIYLHFLRNTEIAEYRANHRKEGPKTAAENKEVEEISVIGDDLTMSKSDMGTRMSLRSRGLKSSASSELVLETKFDENDYAGVPQSTMPHTQNSSRRSSSSSSSSSDDSNEDDTEGGNARGTEEDTCQVDEDDEQASDDTDLESANGEVAVEDDVDNQRSSPTDDHLQGQGYLEEVPEDDGYGKIDGEKAVEGEQQPEGEEAIEEEQQPEGEEAIEEEQQPEVKEAEEEDGELGGEDVDDNEDDVAANDNKIEETNGGEDRLEADDREGENSGEGEDEKREGVVPGDEEV